MRHTSNLRRRLLGVLVVSLAATATVAVAASPAQALGTGEACVFLAPEGGQGLGHIGWGFQIAGSPTWMYGSTENTNGIKVVLPGGYNAAWTRQGTWSQMLFDFTVQAGYPTTARDSRSVQPDPVFPYTQYKCESVSNSAVGSATTAANANANAGYTTVGNNCLDAVVRVLQAYNATNLLPPLLWPDPNGWFASLSSNWVFGKIGETWVNHKSGLYLDVTGAGTGNGAAVRQWSYTGGDNQWWFRFGTSTFGRVFVRSDTYPNTTPLGHPLCLGVHGGSTLQGATPVQWQCNGNPDQLWAWIPTGKFVDGWPVYNILNYDGLCLGISGGSTAVGAQTVQWTCNGNADQEWY